MEDDPIWDPNGIGGVLASCVKCGAYRDRAIAPGVEQVPDGPNRFLVRGTSPCACGEEFIRLQLLYADTFDDW